MKLMSFSDVPETSRSLAACASAAASAYCGPMSPERIWVQSLAPPGAPRLLMTSRWSSASIARLPIALARERTPPERGRAALACLVTSALGTVSRMADPRMPARAGRRRSVLLVAGRGRGTRLLGQRRERELAAGRVLEHARRLLGGARVELDEQVDDDLVLVVLVEAHVGEELARAVVAERGVGEGVGGLGARARLDG